MWSDFEESDHELQLKKVHISPDPADQLFGGIVTLSATTVGVTAISYQWIKNDVDISTMKDPGYNGLGTPELTIVSFAHDYEGKYHCLVGCDGDEVVKSNIVELALGE